MAFAALDDEFFGHPKAAAAGLDGCGLYARSLSYCAHYLTDGFVPKAWVSEIARPAVKQKVTVAGLWVEVTGGEVYQYVAADEAYTVTIPGAGFFIPDYIAFNPSRAEVEAKRSALSDKRSEAGKKGALARWQRDGKADGKTMANGMANAWQSDGPLPLPLKSFPKAVTQYDGTAHGQIKRLTPNLKEVS
jgi:hypothetical protein